MQQCPACNYELTMAEQTAGKGKCPSCEVYFAKYLARKARSQSELRDRAKSPGKSAPGLSRKTKAVAVLIVGALIYVGATPYIAVNKLKAAAETQNAAGLSEQIDFPALRQSVKKQLSARIATHAAQELDDNPFAALGMAFAETMVGTMVDAYITPAGLATMMKGSNPSSGDGQSTPASRDKHEPFSNATMRYQGVNKFAVIVPNETGEEAHFILRRSGLVSWKLADLIIPMN